MKKRIRFIVTYYWLIYSSYLISYNFSPISITQHTILLPFSNELLKRDSVNGGWKMHFSCDFKEDEQFTSGRNGPVSYKTAVLETWQSNRILCQQHWESTRCPNVHPTQFHKRRAYWTNNYRWSTTNRRSWRPIESGVQFRVRVGGDCTSLCTSQCCSMYYILDKHSYKRTCLYSLTCTFKAVK